MDPILDRARAGQGALERLMNAIPGFRGYREKELRRDTDRILREQIATRLDENKKALNDAAAAATRGGGLDVINDIETARKRLDKITNRIRYADRGYAGLFDAVKVDEALLERVYQFDLSLVEGMDAVRTAAQSASGADSRAGLKAMIAEIDAIDARLADREAILSGIR